MKSQITKLQAIDQIFFVLVLNIRILIICNICDLEFLYSNSPITAYSPLPSTKIYKAPSGGNFFTSFIKSLLNYQGRFEQHGDNKYAQGQDAKSNTDLHPTRGVINYFPHG